MKYFLHVIGASPTLIMGLLMMACLTACNPSISSYRKFMGRDEEYYARVAKACNGLLARGPTTIIKEAERLARDTNSLPYEIQEMRPVAILVATNSVSVRIGDGFGAYFITWARPEGEFHWSLSSYQEGEFRVVYTNSL